MAAAIAVTAAAWLVLVVAAPSLPASMAAAAYAAASLICHQIPERSFYQGAVQLPVCARCLGIYAGFAAGALTLCLADAAGRHAPRSVRRPGLVLSALPTVLTVAFEWTGVWTGSNPVRAASGVILGLGLSYVVAWAADTLSYERWRPWGPFPSDPR